MSKRNRIVERASDVNGGQYIQTNPSYNSGYEDGKKAGKEYCASVIESLREQVEKLTKEREELKTVPMKYRRMQFNAELQDEVTQLQKQLAALAEQNEKQRAFLEFAWKDIPMSEYAFEILEHVMNLPDLATPVLNRIRADGMRMAAEILIDPMDRAAAQKICAQADELEKQNG